METVLSHEGDPWSIFVNQNGDIYISEHFRENYTGQVVKYSFDRGTAKKEIIFTTKDKEPMGIFVDQCNTLYTAIYSENGTIEKFYPGNSNSVIIASNLAYPADVLLDKYGNVYFIQLGVNSIKRINTRDGKIEVIIDEIEKVTTKYPDERYSWPMNIVFDSKFNLYVSDQENHHVKMFSFQGGDLFC
jgi:streptogramin lyase